MSSIHGFSSRFLLPLRWKFVACNRDASLSSTLEDPQGFRAIRTAASFPEILLVRKAETFSATAH
jgi:hypothetical protein